MIVKRRFVEVLFAVFLAVPATLFAQTATPSPTAVPMALLPLDHVTEGELIGDSNGQGVRPVYRFALPEAQDLVITLEADKIVYGLYCLQTSTASSTVEDCPGGGGSGSDRPTLSTLFFPTDDDPATRQFVTLTLVRPLEGLSHYSLTPQLITPGRITLDEVSEAAPEAAELYQSYTLEIDPELPFTIEIENAEPDGEFLWVGYEPAGTSRNIGSYISEDPLPAAKYIDSAGSNEDQEGLQALMLMYLGGQKFRLFVRASGDYSIHGAPVEIVMLDAEEPMSVELSYREPMKVVQLDTGHAGATTLNFEVTAGAGVLASVYTLEQAYRDLWRIGQTESGNAGTPLTRTVELPNTISYRTVVLQLPSESTRESVTVEVEWERKT
jgi:hypothetical protein